VRLALDELGRAHLLTDVLTGRPATGGVTRRQTLQRLAAAAVVVPTVATIVAPRAAQAQSGPTGPLCTPAGGPCTLIGSTCCPGLACGSNTGGAPFTCLGG
jgi:hypothetical protein